MAHQKILLESGTHEMEVLTFLLGDQTFGVNAAKVQGILQFDPTQLTKMPEAPPAMLGMLRYRDWTVPLIDLTAALAMESSESSERQIVIVTEFNDHINSILVDGVKQIHRLSWNNFVPIGDFIGSSHVSIIGSVHVDGTEVLIIDMEHILTKFLPDLAFEELFKETVTKGKNLAREHVRIIFAEDSKSIRDIVIRFLKSAGYINVQAFDNGKKAYETLSEMHDKARENGQHAFGMPHVIISDIEMPKMDGMTFCRKIREDLGLRIPVIMFSSLINGQMIEKCRKVGASNYIAKPQLNKLVFIVDELCQ